MHISQINHKSAPKGSIFARFYLFFMKIQAFIFVQNAENAAF